MELTFLGTRGEIDLRTRLHRRHSTLLVRRGRGRVLVDCGADWTGLLEKLRPDAIFLTHAHPDHAAALRSGAPCPVYATEATWRGLARYPVAIRRVVRPEKSVTLWGIMFQAFQLEHSQTAPAVGYRVTADGVRVFYAPDVARICRPTRALEHADLYVGDGASVSRPILRRRNGHLIGHASIRQQLSWCHRQGIRNAVFTHCGSQVVRARPAEMGQWVSQLAACEGVCALIAHDGMIIRLACLGRQTKSGSTRSRSWQIR